MMIRVQTEYFEPSDAFKLQHGREDVGGLSAFVGYVRDYTAGDGVKTLELEHYAGFTETAIEHIVATAHQRFEILDVLVIHRYGKLFPGDPIVLVSVIAGHRDAAFEAARFIMDTLKTDAPFWKKESSENGERWVEPKPSDYEARMRWRKTIFPDED